jgi:hypothetical protein
MRINASIKEYLTGFYHSFPVQLLILHLRRYQVFLIFWFLLASAINGDFMSNFGAYSLFLAPEYLGKVNPLSMALVGMTTAVFIMSWNVTTFILHSKQFKFLATTSKPFLKYCINNSIIPILFLIFYFVESVQFDRTRELLSVGEIAGLAGGFIAGLIFMFLISFLYFFRTEKTLMRKMEPVFRDPKAFAAQFGVGGNHFHEKGLMQVDWFYNTRLKLKRPRNVTHYSQEFIDTVFKRHHFSAVLSIILAFLFLALVGLLIDHRIFKIPAAAAILLFFAILIGAAGALTYWLKSWAFPVLLVFYLILNFLFEKEVIDPRNKAYGLNYSNIDDRPAYRRDSVLELCSLDKMKADKQNMIHILERWKQKQGEEKPLFYVVNVSGGGTRSATFTLNVLQQLDSFMHGDMMKKTFLITGASGGMLGATYYRELYRLRQEGEPINLQDEKYANDISKDLLNALFSSFVSRDLFAPAQRFTIGNYKYAKDRGYAFEQQLNVNTRGILDHQMKDFKIDEYFANIPLMLYSSTITSDGRKMMISTQPISFMMRDWPDTAGGIFAEPDAIDFSAMFKRQDPLNLRLLSALRINATFPYVLPNVWLPSTPIIDVMDAGMRDNYGQETSLRFLSIFNDWLAANTRGVAFIQIRDRRRGEWEDAYEDPSIRGLITKPIMTLQHNWMKMQDYYHEELIQYSDKAFNFPFEKVTFSYIPTNAQQGAALNFHLTAKEKLDIREALYSPENAAAFNRVRQLSSPGTKPAGLGEKPKG